MCFGASAATQAVRLLVRFLRTSTSARWTVTLLVAMSALCLPSLAQASDYMECDNAHHPSYPYVLAHPRACDLGLGQSVYQTQPVPGRAFAAIALRRLRWSNWGSHEATAHGLSCRVRTNGNAFPHTCGHVVVHVYRPQVEVPAGGAVIYRFTRVVHHRSPREPHRYTYAYQTGTDY